MDWIGSEAATYDNSIGDPESPVAPSASLGYRIALERAFVWIPVPFERQRTLGRQDAHESCVEGRSAGHAWRAGRATGDVRRAGRAAGTSYNLVISGGGRRATTRRLVPGRIARRRCKKMFLSINF